MRRWLEEKSDQYDEAEDGQAAYEQFNKMIASGHSYDAVILDWQMPRMTGHEVAVKIREMVDVKQPHIFFVSGHDPSFIRSQLGDMDQRRVSILTKPIRPKAFLTDINGAFSSK